MKKLCVILALVFAMTLAVSAEDIYVPRDFNTIQNAINEALLDDKIIVAAGTYYENITIDKSLIVVSEGGAEETIINAQGVPIAVLINGAETVVTFNGFTVENYDTIGILAGAFRDELQGVLLGDDPLEVHLLNNIVKPPSLLPPHNNNIQVGVGTTGTIIGNEVSGAFLASGDWSGSGILVAASSDILISDNYVYDCEGGIQIMGYAEYRGGPPAEDNIIENNLVENCVTGISVQGNSIRTIIRYNDVLNNDVGIGSLAYDVSWDHSTPLDTEVRHNNIVGNENYGVESSIYWNDTGEILAEEVDAKFNWWGHASGPSGEFGRVNRAGKVVGKGDSVSDDVEWAPWLRRRVWTNPAGKQLPPRLTVVREN